MKYYISVSHFGMIEVSKEVYHNHYTENGMIIVYHPQKPQIMYGDDHFHSWIRP